MIHDSTVNIHPERNVFQVTIKTLNMKSPEAKNGSTIVIHDSTVNIHPERIVVQVTHSNPKHVKPHHGPSLSPYTRQLFSLNARFRPQHMN